MMQPISKAPLTGSSKKLVPGTLTPLGTVVPGTIGPSIFVHAGKVNAKRPHPIVSIKQFLAVERASSELISCFATYSAISTSKESGPDLIFSSTFFDMIYSLSSRSTQTEVSGPVYSALGLIILLLALCSMQ